MIRTTHLTLGVGASHQTDWTGLFVKVIQPGNKVAVRAFLLKNQTIRRNYLGTTKDLSAMRHEFGGHVEKPAGQSAAACIKSGKRGQKQACGAANEAQDLQPDPANSIGKQDRENNTHD